jgi:hypothetical protein
MLSHMKTTVDLPDDLLIRAKKRAAETRTSLRLLIARSLRRELSAAGAGGGRAGAPPKIRWITAPGGLPPGLDVADRESLHSWKDLER